MRPQVRPHLVGHLPYLRERQTGAIQRVHAPPHQVLEIGNVARGEVKLLDAEVVPQMGPDFRRQDAFQIDRGNHIRLRYQKE